MKAAATNNTITIAIRYLRLGLIMDSLLLLGAAVDDLQSFALPGPVGSVQLVMSRNRITFPQRHDLSMNVKAAIVRVDRLCHLQITVTGAISSGGPIDGCRLKEQVCIRGSRRQGLLHGPDRFGKLTR